MYLSFLLQHLSHHLCTMIITNLEAMHSIQTSVVNYLPYHFILLKEEC